MTNLDNLSPEEYKAFTGRDKPKFINPFEDEDFMRGFTSSAFDIDSDTLNKAAEILRHNGYKVINKRNKRK